MHKTTDDLHKDGKDTHRERLVCLQLFVTKGGDAAFIPGRGWRCRDSNPGGLGLLKICHT